MKPLFPLLLTFFLLAPESRSDAALHYTLKNLSKDEKQPATEALQASRAIIESSRTFLQEISGISSNKKSFASLRTHIIRLKPHLSERLFKAFSEYAQTLEVYLESEASKNEFLNCDHDPLLARKWQPEAEVLELSYDEPAEYPHRPTIILNELLITGKIYSGYQGKTELRFLKNDDGKLVVNEIVIKRRYDHPDENWETSIVKKELIEATIKMEKKLKALGIKIKKPEPAATSKPAEPLD